MTDRKQLARLRRLQDNEQALLATRRKMQEIIVRDLLPKHPSYAQLDERRRQLRHDLHQAHLNVPRKLKAAVRSEARAAKMREEAKAIDVQELQDQQALAIVEAEIERLHQSLIDHMDTTQDDAA